MIRKKYKSVPEFIKDYPKDTQSILKKLRATIKAIIPEAEETISYNIPCYKVNGRYAVYFAGYEKHVSIYPVPKNATKSMADEITKYRAGKGTLRFPLAKPLPMAFIKKVIKELASDAILRTADRI